MSKVLPQFPLSAKDILAPTRNPDGYCYIRMPRRILRGLRGFFYADVSDNDRVISARKAEGGAEVIDFLKLCKERGLYVSYEPDRNDASDVWWVGDGDYRHSEGHASTLRGAYYAFCEKNGIQP